MRGDAATMEVIRPSSGREALEALRRNPRAVPLAGGTDFMVGWNVGLSNGRAVLDLSGVSGWDAIRRKGKRLEIGALATHARIRDNALVRRDFPLLSEACATVGAVQIQNRGTIGGNIANASPAGDTFPPLAVYEAMVRVASADGVRRIPFLEIFAGVKKTTLRLGELIEAVEIPFPSAKPARRIFRKVGTRAAQAISKTVAAGVLWLGRGNEVREVRFALGSVAPTVRRLKSAEDFLRGRALTPEVIEDAVDLVERDISPIDDIRSTRGYRLEVSRNILRLFLKGERV